MPFNPHIIHSQLPGQSLSTEYQYLTEYNTPDNISRLWNHPWVQRGSRPSALRGETSLHDQTNNHTSTIPKSRSRTVESKSWIAFPDLQTHELHIIRLLQCKGRRRQYHRPRFRQDVMVAHRSVKLEVQDAETVLKRRSQVTRNASSSFCESLVIIQEKFPFPLTSTPTRREGPKVDASVQTDKIPESSSIAMQRSRDPNMNFKSIGLNCPPFTPTPPSGVRSKQHKPRTSSYSRPLSELDIDFSSTLLEDGLSLGNVADDIGPSPLGDSLLAADPRSCNASGIPLLTKRYPVRAPHPDPHITTQPNGFSKFTHRRKPGAILYLLGITARNHPSLTSNSTSADSPNLTMLPPIRTPQSIFNPSPPSTIFVTAPLTSAHGHASASKGMGYEN